MAVDTQTAPALQVAKKINGKRIRVPPRVSLGDLTVNNLGTLKKLNLVLFPVAYSDRFYKDVLDPKLTPESYSKIIFYQDLAVGNIVCRSDPVSLPTGATLSASLSPQAEPVPSSSSGAPAARKDEAHRLYIMTLGVLAPYRRQGLASKLVQHVIAAAEASHRPPVASEYKIKPPTVPEDTPLDKKKKLDKGKPAPKEPEPLLAQARPPLIESVYAHVQVGNDEARAFWEGQGFNVRETVQGYYRKITPRDAWVLERKIVVDK